MPKIPSTVVSISFYNSQLKQIKEYGKATNMNRSEIVREAVQEYFDKRGMNNE